MMNDPDSGPRHRWSTTLRPIRHIAIAAMLCAALTACKTSAEKAEEYYQDGLKLLAEGDAERAMVQFRNVFNIEGTHYEARKTLAETLLARGELSPAYSQYLRLAEQYPDDVEIRVALARLAFDMGSRDEFERHAEQAATLAPDSDEAKVLTLVRNYNQSRGSGSEDQRAALVAEAQRLAASRPDDRLLLGVLVDGAVVAGETDQALDRTNRLIELAPDNLVYYQQRLALLARKEDGPAIEAHLRETIERFPDYTDAQSDLLRYYLAVNDMDAAEAFLRERIEMRSDPAQRQDAQMDLVRFLDTRRDPATARAEVEKFRSSGGDPLVFDTVLAGMDFRDGKRDEAIAKLRGMLAEAQPPAEGDQIAAARINAARVQLARMLAETGDLESSRAEIGAVLAADPRNVDALKISAGWQIDADQTDQAISSLRLVLDQEPDDATALSLMADAYTRAGDRDLARDFMGQALTASGNDPGVAIRHARALMAEQRYRPAEDALLPALRNDTGNIALLAALGEVYLAMPDLPRAEGVITRLRELDNEQARRAAETLELRRLGDLEGDDAAIGYLEELAKDDTLGDTARVQLIRARLAAGDGPGALTLAQQLVDSAPDNRAYQSVLGLATAAAGDMDAATDIQTRLRDEQPDDPMPHLALIRLAAMQGETDAFRAYLDEALAALPDNPDLLIIASGQAERDGDTDRAIEINEKLYAANSESIVVANNLASLLATYRGDDPAAVDRAEIVARRLHDSEVPAFMDTYGWIRHLKGDSAAALPYLEKAAEGLPRDRVVQIHLGLVQAALGIDAARAQLELGLSQLPEGTDSIPISAARAALAQLDAGAATQTDAATTPEPAAEATPDPAAATDGAAPAEPAGAGN